MATRILNRSVIRLAVFGAASAAVCAMLLAAIVPALSKASSPLAQDAGADLIAAARRKDLAGVKAQLAKGADANSKSNMGATALSYAADRGSVEIVKLLIEHGADVNVRDNFYHFTPLFWACSRGFAEVGKVLIDKGGAGKEEALIIAASLGFVDFVKMVLDTGNIKPETLTAALKNAQQATSDTPPPGQDAEAGGSQTTQRISHAEVIQLLKQAGAAGAEHSAFQIEPELLKAYAGTYRSPDRGLRFAIKDGKLTETIMSWLPLTLRPTDRSSFAFQDMDGVSVVFHTEGDKVVGLTLKQGGLSTEFKKIEER